MFSAMLILFRPDGSRDIADFTGARMQAALLDVVRMYDPSLSAAMHDGDWPRGLAPYTVSAAWVPAGAFAPRTSPVAAVFRLTILDQGLFGPIVSAIAQCGYGFRPGQVPAPIVGIDSDWRSSFWVGMTTAEELWERAPADETARLLVLSPSAFRKSGSTSPVVEPEAGIIGRSMLLSWDAWSGVEVDRRAAEELQSSIAMTVNAQSRGTVRVHRNEYAGFTGVLDFHVDGAAAAKLLHALLAFSFYAGLGMKTTAGMGQVAPIAARASFWQGGAAATMAAARRDSPRDSGRN